MEVLVRYGTPEQQERWLKPLLRGEIRSAFAMTEPDVASSDATNISSTIRREGNEYVVNGRKWYISGAGHPNCEVMVFLGKSNPEAAGHQQHSMILSRRKPGRQTRTPMLLLGTTRTRTA